MGEGGGAAGGGPEGMEEEFLVLKYLFLLKGFLGQHLKRGYRAVRQSAWKNGRSPPHVAYVPTDREHLANILTHGLLVPPTAWLSATMYQAANGPAQQWAALVYGAVLTGLFTVSTVFHTVAALSQASIWRDLLHRGDRAMIYLFIAGSYTPWLHLRQLGGAAAELRWAVWLLATLGILYQQVFHERWAQRTGLWTDGV
jgi:monocyte-to-macrophage differentiation protein